MCWILIPQKWYQNKSTYLFPSTREREHMRMHVKKTAKTDNGVCSPHDDTCTAEVSELSLRLLLKVLPVFAWVTDNVVLNVMQSIRSIPTTTSCFQVPCESESLSFYPMFFSAGSSLAVRCSFALWMQGNLVDVSGFQVTQLESAESLRWL